MISGKPAICDQRRHTETLHRRMVFRVIAEFVYFIASQLLFIPIMYGFTRIDWHAMVAGQRFKWLRGSH